MNHKKRLIELVEILADSLEDAPIDFLGTGDSWRLANKEEKEWNTKWIAAYNEVLEILNK